MSLNYHVVKRRIMQGPLKDEFRYYGQVRKSKKIPFKKLCQKIALQSSATKGDVELILNGLVTALIEHLDNGDIVPVGDLGNFRMSAGSRPAETLEEFNSNYMRRPRVIFTPSVELKEMVRNVGFERMDPVIEICDKVHAA